MHTRALLFGSLLAFGTSKIFAQEPDHLTMQMVFKDSSVTIDAEYQANSHPNLDSIYFLLNPGYAIDTIASKGLMSYSVTQKPGMPLPFFHLKFDPSIVDAEDLRVSFKYTIDLNLQNHMKSQWIELNADKIWFPHLGDLNDELTYEVTLIDFPASYSLITHTDATVTTNGNHIQIKKEEPWFEVLIIAGEDMKEWQYDENITLIGRNDIPYETIQSMGAIVKNSIDTLNRYFGPSDPITSFRLVLRNTTRDELGFQFNRRDMIVTGTEFNDYGNLSHEIAHYWWSKANFIEEPWMNESFANFSMYLVLRAFESEEYDELLARNRALCENAIPVADAHLFAEASYNSYYHKGALHLLELEERIGLGPMKRLMSTCLEMGIITTASFLDELEKQTNTEQRLHFENLLKS